MAHHNVVRHHMCFTNWTDTSKFFIRQSELKSFWFIYFFLLLLFLLTSKMWLMVHQMTLVHHNNESGKNYRIPKLHKKWTTHLDMVPAEQYATKTLSMSSIDIFWLKCDERCSEAGWPSNRPQVPFHLILYVR